MIANTPAAWDERALTTTTSWDAAMWSQPSQARRFHTVRQLLLERVGEFDETLLDYGCGTARFASFMPSEISYVGYDWSPEMRARARRQSPRATIVDSLDDDDRFVFDHVVCIGPFNLADNWSKEQTWETIEELWTQHTRRSLVVSLFRARAQTPSGMLAYTPTDALELVERLGCKSWRLIADHLPNDLILGAWRDDDRHGAPAELPARHVGAVEDQGV